MKKATRSSTTSDSDDEPDDEPVPLRQSSKHVEPDNETFRLLSSKTTTVRRAKGTIVKWSETEKKIIKKEFAQFFRLKKAPNEEAVRLAIQRNNIWKHRTVAQIKSRALHMIVSGRLSLVS